MKYFLAITLFTLTCCKQPAKKEVEKINEPIRQTHLEGKLDEIMEQVRDQYKVSYSFAYDAGRISSEEYYIPVPKNTPLQTTLEVIAATTNSRIELKNGYVEIYEK